MSDYAELMRRAEGRRVVRRATRGSRVRVAGDGLYELAREEMVKLVLRVFLSPPEEARPHVVLFCGVDRGTGCTSICGRAGEMLATQVEHPVCVVDANNHAPSMHDLFGMQNLRGLTDTLVRPEPVQEFLHRVPHSNLSVLMFGQRSLDLSAPRILDRFRARMEELRSSFGSVLVDAAPVNQGSSVLQLTRFVDGVILVLESNSTRRVAARRAKEALDSANANLLGAVLNKRTFPIPGFLYDRL